MRSALLLAAMLNGLAFNVLAQTAPGALTDNAPAVPSDVVRACLPVQYQSGAVAYGNCIKEELALRDQLAQANSEKATSAKTTSASRGSSDDTTSADIASADIASANAIKNQADIRPDPDIEKNRTIVEQSTATPVSNVVTNTASTRPRLIDPPINENPENGLPAAAEPDIDLEGLGIRAVKKPDTQDAFDLLAPASNPEPLPAPTDIETTNQSNQPDAQSSTPSSTPSSTDNDLDGTAADDVSPIDQFKQLFSRFKNLVVDSFGGLSQQGKLLVAAIVAMPIALWFLLSGRGSRHSAETRRTRENLKNRVMTQHELQEEYERAQLEPIPNNWAFEADSLFDDSPEPEHTAIGKPNHRFDTNLARSHQEEAPSSRLRETGINQKSQHSGFAAWLRSQAPTDQLSLSIEFLMYWMAFGDERYDPDLKRRIFQTPNLSKHDTIKRWVLKEDVHAFADVIEWMQKNTTSKQKEQIVRLLMAMLINGERPTPLQNTLLRFLSDVFYLENPTLEAIFKHDFGLNLPAMPRVDRLAWWRRQPPGSISLWNAQAINAGDEFTRHAAQLGLNSNARIEHIEAAYEKAIARCNPDRFDHLNEREHQLIASRRSRLSQSRDELMEALA